MLIFICSCTNELKVKPSINVESSMAINCLFSPEQAWKIDLVQTKGVDDSLSYNSLNDASININDTWVPDDFEFIPPTSTFELGYYANITSDKNVLSDIDVYNIKIEREGFNTISASDTIPEKPVVKDLQIDQIEVQELNIFGGLRKRYDIQGTLSFNLDNLDPENNYLVKVYFENDYVVDLFGNKTDSLYLNEALINFSNIESDISFNSFKGFQLNNSENELIISFSHNSLKDQSAPNKMIVEISTISNVYYNYLDNLNEIKQVVQNPFSNQIIPFSNIEGGYGIFAAFNNQIDTLSY